MVQQSPEILLEGGGRGLRGREGEVIMEAEVGAMMLHCQTYYLVASSKIKVSHVPPNWHESVSVQRLKTGKLYSIKRNPELKHSPAYEHHLVIC